MEYVIKAPKATIVEAVHIKNGQIVSVGDPLFSLPSYDEEMIFSQIDRAIKESEIKRDEVAEFFSTQKLAMMKSVADAKIRAAEAAQIAYDGIVQEAGIGARTILDCLRARQDVIARTNEALQASVEMQIFQMNCEDTIKSSDQIVQLLRAEKSYVEQVSTRLRIVAPAHGRVNCFVLPGTPVPLGHVLATII